jgi:hypothetical protein
MSVIDAEAVVQRYSAEVALHMAQERAQERKMDRPMWGKTAGSAFIDIGYVIGLQHSDSSALTGYPTVRYDWDPTRQLHLNFQRDRTYVDPHDLLIGTTASARTEHVKLEYWNQLTDRFAAQVPHGVLELLKRGQTSTDRRWREHCIERVRYFSSRALQVTVRAYSGPHSLIELFVRIRC